MGMETDLEGILVLDKGDHGEDEWRAPTWDELRLLNQISEAASYILTTRLGKWYSAAADVQTWSRLIAREVVVQTHTLGFRTRTHARPDGQVFEGSPVEVWRPAPWHAPSLCAQIDDAMELAGQGFDGFEGDFEDIDEE